MRTAPAAADAAVLEDGRATQPLSGSSGRFTRRILQRSGAIERARAEADGELGPTARVIEGPVVAPQDQVGRGVAAASRHLGGGFGGGTAVRAEGEGWRAGRRTPC